MGSLIKFISILSMMTSFIISTSCSVLPPDSLDCCSTLPQIINDTIVKQCVKKMVALDKKNQIQRPITAPPGGLCLLECFVNETSLAVKGNVTTDTVQKSLYSLLNGTTTRMWRPLIDKYVPKCVGDYQNFKKDKATKYEKMNAGQKQGGQANALEGNCCPSSGYLVSRIMAEFFIHCPNFNGKVPKCNLYAEQVKKTSLYVIAQDLTSFTS